MMNTPSDPNEVTSPTIESSIPAPTRRSRRGPWLIPLVVILVLTAVGAGLAYHFHWGPQTRACVPGANVRHTLPCDIPLLSDATFKSVDSGTASDGSGNTITAWEFTTPKSLDQLTRFYETAFSEDGWPCVGGTVVLDLLAIAATNKTDRPNTVVFMAFQINTAMSPNEFYIFLVHYTKGNSPLKPEFKCGNLPK
jgi:hypothetical protein